MNSPNYQSAKMEGSTIFRKLSKKSTRLPINHKDSATHWLSLPNYRSLRATSESHPPTPSHYRSSAENYIADGEFHDSSNCRIPSPTGHWDHRSTTAPIVVFNPPTPANYKSEKTNSSSTTKCLPTALPNYSSENKDYGFCHKTYQTTDEVQRVFQMLAHLT